MPHHRYLVIGGGMTADAAVRGIRSEDPDGSLGILSEEPHPPYDRPPLSKGLWNGVEEDRIWRQTADLDVHLHLGRRALRLDRETHTVTDDRGGVYTYDRLLMATGSRPVKLASDVPGVIYFRTLDDYRRLRKLTQAGRKFGVIGGGFIGTEIASSLAKAGKEVTLLFPEDRPCSRVTTPETGHELTRLFRRHGVDVRPGVTVTTVRRSGPKLLISLAGDRPETLRLDGVVAGLGTEPNTLLAEGAGLEVDNGIVVDSSFQTSDADVFAAGDVAAFWSAPLGRTLRIEHEDHANASGTVAGRAMAGAKVVYDDLPSFYSTIFDTTYEVVGEVAPDMEVVEDWIDPLRKGAVYYLRGGRIRGVALWNVPKKIRAARELVLENASLAPASERARITIR